MKLLDLFKWNRNFLAKSQLRSLRNLKDLPSNAVDEVIASVMNEARTSQECSDTEFSQMIGVLYDYTYYCQGSNVYKKWLQLTGAEYVYTREYLHALDEQKDPFAGCYFADGTITAKGLELRMETRTRIGTEVTAFP